MRKRQEKKGIECRPETLNQNPIKEEEIEKKGEVGEGFFACYLLTSLSPRYKGHTYIGFTVNPRRRIRQHNGEITCGAFRTKRRRPWEMVLCIYGFPTNVSALQFEWAWQHPAESLAVRQAAATFKSFSGVANKIKLAYTMLNLPNWQSLTITVNYFSTKYSKHAASCPSLPDHMEVQVCSMDDLPCYTRRDESLFGDEGGWGDEDCDETSDNSGSLGETSTDKSINASSDFLLANEEAFCERFAQVKQYGEVLARDSSSQGVDCQQSLGLINLQTALTSSVVTNIPSTATIQGCRNELGLQRSEQFITAVDADENQQPCLWEKQFKTTEVTNKDQQTVQSSHASQNVEVIDLLTPSPSCRVRSCGKKRRVSSLSPVIIDLT
ncbi:uncharacterized protein LOC123210117 [Mangifera indica]|uniref:uncharacterized protein LOC123210117 n=1 Tax=Mangifera indica TaxID=29780 RepID=UPI001CFA60E9|nr:uncharacterized protein LOC123210117 [Mangifera indica]